MQNPTQNGIPMLGLGTFGRTGEAGLAAIMAALELGYRHLDTAQSYGTEEEVGRAIRRSGLKRAEVFVTTKIRNANLPREQVLPSVRQSLDTLGLDRLDLLLIHWPAEKEIVPLADYMEELAKAKQLGLTPRIGVSNFTIDLIERALSIVGAGQLANNQLEVHPFLQNRKLVDHCQAQGIAVTAYCPLAKGKVAADPVVRSIAASHAVPPSAVALAWLRQRGIIAIPASGTPANLGGNWCSLDITLTEAEMTAMAGLERGERIIDPAKSPSWDA